MFKYCLNLPLSSLISVNNQILEFQAPESLILGCTLLCNLKREVLKHVEVELIEYK